MLKKLLAINPPKAGGLISTVQKITLWISVLVLAHECLNKFLEGYAKLTIHDNDEKREGSTASPVGPGPVATPEN